MHRREFPISPPPISPLDPALHSLDLLPPANALGLTDQDPMSATASDASNPYTELHLRLPDNSRETTDELIAGFLAVTRSAGSLASLHVINPQSVEQQAEIVNRLPERLSNGDPFPSGLVGPLVFTEGLSAIQLEVILLAALDWSDERIAHELRKSMHTIKSRFRSAGLKYGRRGRINLIGTVFGLLPPPETIDLSVPDDEDYEQA